MGFYTFIVNYLIYNGYKSTHCLNKEKNWSALKKTTQALFYGIFNNSLCLIWWTLYIQYTYVLNYYNIAQNLQLTHLVQLPCGRCTMQHIMHLNAFYPTYWGNGRTALTIRLYVRRRSLFCLGVFENSPQPEYNTLVHCVARRTITFVIAKRKHVGSTVR